VDFSKIVPAIWELGRRNWNWPARLGVIDERNSRSILLGECMHTEAGDESLNGENRITRGLPIQHCFNPSGAYTTVIPPSTVRA